MEHLEYLRAQRFDVPVAERLGIAQAILRGASPCDGLWELFANVPEVHVRETFSILINYYVPERTILTNMLQFKEPCDPAAPPSRLQLGFLRSRNDLWNDAAPASRLELWDYMLFRWAVQYFERTLTLMIKSFNNIEEVALMLQSIDPNNLNTRSILMASIVAYHSNLLCLLAPRIRLILDAPEYCRDSTEYNELLLLTQYVLMSAEVPKELKLRIPLERLFLWGAGMSDHVQSVSLRCEAILTIAAMDSRVLENWVRECTDPHLVPSICRIITELPTEVHYVAILALSFSNLLIDIAWDLSHRPFLYESAIHILLSATQLNASYLLQSVLASNLFLRFSHAFPRRNIIETCFYSFTAVLQQTKHEPVFRHQIEENLRGALTTNGNRSTFINLVSLQDKDIQSEWSILFPSLAWPRQPEHVLLDSVTEQPIAEAWHFEKDDSTPVGLETIVHHAATNGLRNPFTNVPLTWDHLLTVNQKSV